MSDLMFKKGLSTAKPQPSVVDGQIIYHTDTSRMYIDGTTRKELNYVPQTQWGTNNQKGIVYSHPAENCTSFTSDASAACTPLAVQKGAELFAITRPPKRSPSNPANPGNPGTCTTNNIVRWLNAAGDVQDSKIKIEDVTNTRNSSKKAQVISIPAEPDPKTKKDQKMVYGYCTDQVDGTSFIGGLFPADATEYPYNAGLAIGGTTGNLLWKGRQVVTAPKSNSTQQAFIVGTASPSDNMNNQIFDPWIYLGAEEGQLVATKFTGDLDGNAASADTAKALAKADGSSYTEGSATKPVYFKNGKPVATTYALNATVPVNAKFTDTKVTNTLATTTKAYITGTEFATTNTGTQVFDTGVYLDTTAGQLVATTFKGNLDGNASSASKLGSTTIGGSTTPIYLNAGTPTACGFKIMVANDLPDESPNYNGTICIVY